MAASDEGDGHDASGGLPEGEAQFVARLVARDEAAFNELVTTYERRVFALVFRMLGRRDEAEDLAQEVKGICVRSAFKKNVSRPHHMNLIAEIKKASPSKGILRGDFNPAKIAITYQAGGASAVAFVPVM